MNKPALRHDAFAYEADDSFVTTLAPFVTEGLAREEAVFVAARPHHWGMLRAALDGRTDEIQFVESAEWYRKPEATIAAYWNTLVAARSAGVPGLRVIGEVEFGATEHEQSAWTRYESVVNEVFRDQPTWIVCPYDRRRLPESVVRDATRTHAHRFSLDGRDRSNAYEDPTHFVGPMPLELPGELVAHRGVDSRLGPVRELVKSTARLIGLGSERTEEMVLAVNEVVSNALMHAAPPIEVQVWSDGTALVYQVSDSGPGITDPMAGFRPPTGSAVGGAGLWTARQLADQVEVVDAPKGTTVRLLVTRWTDPRVPPCGCG